MIVIARGAKDSQKYSVDLGPYSYLTLYPFALAVTMTINLVLFSSRYFSFNETCKKS